jgi:hypothetical protein
MSIARSLLWASLLLGGCTAGQIVDANYKALPQHSGTFTFAAVDDRGRETGTVYTYSFAVNNPTAVVSFDAYAPDTMGSASGTPNSKQTIYEGKYRATLTVPVAGSTVPSVHQSLIFSHSYDESCADALTGQSDPECAKYYFQVIDDFAPTDPCLGSSGPCPWTTTKGDVKVLPLYLQLG